MSHEQGSSIETGVGDTLSFVCNQVVAGAGLAVMRGAVGIGKTFALDRIARDLEEQGVMVVMITATEAVSGNINAFLKAVLGYGCAPCPPRNCENRRLVLSINC